MSSNYTGNPTATQAPSPTPGIDVNPVTVLPSDGDAFNAASVAQAYKVLADYTAFLTNNSLFNAIYGQGIYGDVVMDGVNTFANFPKSGAIYTANATMYAENLTLESFAEFRPSGFPIYVRDTTTINVGSVISRNGNAAVSNSGASALTGGCLGSGTAGGNGGTSGGAGSAGNSSNLSVGAGGNGGAGGTGSSGSTAAGTGGQVDWLETNGPHRSFNAVITGRAGSTIIQGGAGGGGGGGGTAVNTGGGGGGGGGVILLATRKLVLNGVIQALGGVGANGTTNGGGGGGGGGGCLLILYRTFSGSGSASVAGGNGGNGNGTGANGSAGVTGNIISLFDY